MAVILRRLFVALLLVAPAVAAEPSALGPDYNVIIVSLTNVGASRLGLYGYSRPTTPYLDAWAREALVFEDAYSHASWTLPAATSLMTGVYPYTHGVWSRSLDKRLPPGIRTLAQELTSRGYLTAAFAGGLDYYYKFSHLDGFDFKSPNPHFTDFLTTVEQARKWLAAYGDKKFFLFVQGYDAHCPFVAQEGFRGFFTASLPRSPLLDPTRCLRGLRRSSGSFKAQYAGGCPRLDGPSPSCVQGDFVTLTDPDVRYIEASYDETVRQADHHIQQLLAGLPAAVAARTIIVITAEHGEMFAEHGRFGRAGTLRGAHYGEVLRVPLLMRLPGMAGRRVRGLAQVVDVMPTLLDLLEFPVPASIQGRSLRPLIETGTLVNDFVYSGLPYNIQPQQTEVNRRLFGNLNLSESVQNLHWKLLHESVAAERSDAPDKSGEAAEVWELYDIETDPKENSDLAASHPEEVERLKVVLLRWRERTLSARQAAIGTEPTPKSLRQQAFERGYWQ